tara:strand:- start:4582 stop:4863 length:282 start_codon:yes stop_codon:yes gene_type:complete
LKLNKAFLTPDHKTKSHAVFVKIDGKVKKIRFGSQGVKGVGNKQDAKSKKIRRAFFNRHKKNIMRGKISPAYHSNKEKWGGLSLYKAEKKRLI